MSLARLQQQAVALDAVHRYKSVLTNNAVKLPIVNELQQTHAALR
jgi:hypothetical protein